MQERCPADGVHVRNGSQEPRRYRAGSWCWNSSIGGMVVFSSFVLSWILADPSFGRAGSDPGADPMDQVLLAVDGGRFEEAEKILRERIEGASEADADRYRIELEMIRRIRLDFNLTANKLLEKIKTTLPDITMADIDRWRDEGELQYRIIDGHICYFDSEPNNLFRFSEDARARRRQTERPERSGWKFALPQHIARLLEMARDSDCPFVYPVKHSITYRLAVNENHPRLATGAKVRCWLPYPQAYRQQGKVRLVATQPEQPVIAPAGHPHRTIYLERTVEDPATAPVFEASFEFETSAYCPDLAPDQVTPYDRQSQLFQECTAERPPHIVFTPEIRHVVAEIASAEPNPLRRARKLFRWVNDHIRYCSEMEYSTIRNLSAKALATRKGDCGVQGMLLITLYRAAGIPARWQSGWETKPNGWNMHDWIEFYVEPWGWLPADPSYGLQQHEDPRVQEFYCGGIDPYRLIVNLDYGRDLVPAKASFRSEPNDFQRGEIEIDGQNLYFDEWTWDMQLRTVPQTGDFMALEEALDAVLPNTLMGGKLSGAVVSVGKKLPEGYATWRKAYGYKQFHPEVEPMPVDAVFDMASMTKPIATGTGLMILAEQGKIHMDDPVGQYLPEFKTDAKKGVTIRHLMTHMSGERPYIGEPARKKIIADHGFPCPEAIRKHIREIDLIRPPGEAMQYSCLNAILCAEIIRAVSGMEHSEFVARHVFEPLGMADSVFCPSETLDARLVPTTSMEYGRGPGQYLLGQVHDPLAAMQNGVSGNAGLFSTVDDLSKYAQMLLNQGELNGIRILRPETIAQMIQVQNPGAKNTEGKPSPRGLLWGVYGSDSSDPIPDPLAAYGHTGYTGTAIRIYPHQGIYVIALANRVHPDDTGKVEPFREAVWRTVREVLMDTNHE